MRSKNNQQIIKEKLNIDCLADPYFKRTMAERSVREFKTRMSILLDQLERKKRNNKKTLNNQIHSINFRMWKEHVDRVVNSINSNKKTFRSKTAILLDYFTQKPTVSLPQQQPKLYRYEIGTRVRFFLTKAERQQLGFKYSLAYGKITLDIRLIFFCLPNYMPIYIILYRCFISSYRNNFKPSYF